MEKRKFQVAVILVNYNSSKYTIDCIQSIFKQSSSTTHFQVIVVDNNSEKEDFQRLEEVKGLENVTVFRSKLNVGFSGANMLGVQLASADYYYFLNNDCVILNDCLSILLDFMESHPHVGNCSGEMLISNDKYEYNFRNFPSLALKLLGSGLLRLLYPERFPDRHRRLEKPTRVDLVNGSSMFIRARPFEAIGGFDTNYFLYCEEEDIALRLYRAGYFTFLVPPARYKHFISRSTQSDGKINLPFLKEFYISFFYYVSKNYGYGHRLAMRWFYIFKIGRKFYKNSDYLRLAMFVAGGAHMKHSLRFKQKISDE